MATAKICPLECYLQSETKIEPDLRLNSGLPWTDPASGQGGGGDLNLGPPDFNHLATLSQRALMNKRSAKYL